MYAIYNNLNNLSKVKREQFKFGVLKYTFKEGFNFKAETYVKNILNKTSSLKSVYVYETDIDPEQLISLRDLTNQKGSSYNRLKQVSYYVFLAYSKRQNFTIDENNTLCKPNYHILKYDKTEIQPEVITRPEYFTVNLSPSYVLRLSELFDKLYNLDNGLVKLFFYNTTILNQTQDIVGVEPLNQNDEFENTENIEMNSQLLTKDAIIMEALQQPSYSKLYDFIMNNSQALLIIDEITKKYDALQRVKEALGIDDPSNISDEKDFVKQPQISFSQASGINEEIQEQSLLDNQSENVISDSELLNELNLNNKFDKLINDKEAYKDSLFVDYIFENQNALKNYLKNYLNKTGVDIRKVYALPKFLIYYFNLRKSTLRSNKANSFLIEIYDYLPQNIQAQYSEFNKK